MLDKFGITPYQCWYYSITSYTSSGINDHFNIIPFQLSSLTSAGNDNFNIIPYQCW